MWWGREQQLRAEIQQLRAERREDMREVWQQFRGVAEAMHAAQQPQRWQRSKVAAAVIGAVALVIAKLIEAAPQLIHALAALIGALLHGSD